MRGKVARTFRHYALERWEALSPDQQKVVECRKMYKAMKTAYKEGRRCSLSG